MSDIVQAMVNLAPGGKWRVVYNDDGTADYDSIEWSELTPKPTKDEVDAAIGKGPSAPTLEQQAQKLFENNEVAAVVAARLAELAGHTLEQEIPILIQKYKDLRRPKAPGGVVVD